MNGFFTEAETKREVMVNNGCVYKRIKRGHKKLNTVLRTRIYLHKTQKDIPKLIGTRTHLCLKATRIWCVLSAHSIKFVLLIPIYCQPFSLIPE